MGKISIDKSLIKDLSDLINENNLSEITVTQGRNSVKVARNIISSGPIVSHSNIVFFFVVFGVVSIRLAVKLIP